MIFLNIFDRIFGKMFGSIANAAQAKAERETVGKAEAKVMGAQQRMQQQALRSMDKVGPDMMKKGDGAQQQGGAAAGIQPVSAGYQPAAYEMQQPQVGAPPMGQQQHFCPNGHPIDPSWDVCPYCRTAVTKGQQASAYQAPSSAGAPAKTVAIDPSALLGTAHVNKSVVGWIVAMNGQQKGQDFRLHDGRNVLGTAADCDLVIFDPYLSARHAVFLIESSKGRYILQDLDSRNGTYVNRQRIIKNELVDNDEIRFGQTEFRFKALF